MRDVIEGFALLQYGNVQNWGQTIRSAERALLPGGEGCPPLDHWLDRLRQARDMDEVREIVRMAREELETWRRRPEPAPPSETLDDLKRRIVFDGEGWTPHEVALAMRVTPTLVRHVRAEADRDAEYGRPDAGLQKGLALLSGGMSLRQVERVTGIPKSTLHDAHRRAA